MSIIQSDIQLFSVQAQPRPGGTKSEFASKVDEARNVLVSMAAQERSIHDSLRDSRKAIWESRLLLMEPARGPV